MDADCVFCIMSPQTLAVSMLGGVCYAYFQEVEFIPAASNSEDTQSCIIEFPICDVCNDQAELPQVCPCIDSLVNGYISLYFCQQAV